MQRMAHTETMSSIDLVHHISDNYLSLVQRMAHTVVVVVVVVIVVVVVVVVVAAVL